MKRIVILVIATLVVSCTEFRTSKTVRKDLNTQIDKWHKDAATVNFDDYFNFIADDGVFIGTDISERWTKTEFSEFSKPYFDNGKAWSFIPEERIIRFNTTKDIAWFDEVLDTWMGDCRATGVLSIENDELKLEHYQLSVTIDNDLMPEFLDLIK